MASFPLTAGFRTLDFTSNTATRQTTSLSGVTQRVRLGQHFWTMTLKSPPMSRADFMADYSFIVAQEGQFNAFTIVPPTLGSTRGTMTGTVTVSDATSTTPLLDPSAGSKTVGITDDGSTASGTLKKGDLIKFSNHDKVYMLTEDLELNGDSAVKQMSFFPELRETVTSSTTVTFNDVPLTVFLTTDTAKFTQRTDGLYTYELSLKEDI